MSGEDRGNLFHDEFKGTDNHQIHSFEYETQADRLAATGYVQCDNPVEKPFGVDDIGKVAKQINISGTDGVQTYWVLTGHDPISWKEITNETVPDLDIKVKATASDQTAGFLQDKLSGETGIYFTIENQGGNEKVKINHNLPQIDEKVKASTTDQSAGFLQDKLIAETGIYFTLENQGGNEKVKLNHNLPQTDEKVRVSENDQNRGFLEDKLIAETGIYFTVEDEGGDEKLKLNHNLPQTDEKVKASPTDTTPKTLFEKLELETGLYAVLTNEGGDEKVKIGHNLPVSDELVKVSDTDTTPKKLYEAIQQGTGITITKNNQGSSETLTVSCSGGANSEMPAVQARRSSSYYFPEDDYEDVYFNETDVENIPAVLNHDDNDTDRVHIHTGGVFLIGYQVTANAPTYEDDIDVWGRVRKNDSETLDGSVAASSSQTGDSSSNSQYGLLVNFFVATLPDDCFISLQFKRNCENRISATDPHFVVIKLQGAKGDKGDPGSGSTITIKKKGILLGTFDTINFEAGNPVDNEDGSVTLIKGCSFGENFKEVYEDARSETNNTDYEEKITLITDDLPLGDYRVGVYYEWAASSTSYDFKAEVKVNDEDYYDHHQEPKDGGTDQELPASGFFYLDQVSGVKTIKLVFCSENHNATAYIKNARLEFWRVK